MSTFQKFHDSVESFNKIAGNLQDVTDEAFFVKLGNQINLIVEELNETVDAFETADAVGVLDGIIDILVVATGALQMLKTKGFDTDKALINTATNNLSKYPDSLQKAVHAQDKLKEKGVETTLHHEDGYFALKRVPDGKIMKPYWFVSNDLSDCVPDLYKRGEFEY